MEIEFGKTKIEIPYGNIFESCYGKNNPFEALFSNLNLDYLCSETPPSMADYLKEFNKYLEKCVNINKSNSGDSKDTPGILPANGHDICNYLARYGMANFQIQTIMKLDGQLDFDKLSKAVRLSIDAEPIFGCRFIEGDPPYWKRIENIDETMFCSFEITDNSDEAVQRFLESPLDMDNDPMVKLHLIRFNQNDTLCIKINHACCDGGGVKEYIQLLSRIYTRIDQGNESLEIKPNIGGRKDQDKLFSELGIKYTEIVWNPLLMSPKTAWIFPLKQTRTNEARFAICRLPQGQLDIMSKYGKPKGATINDLILTAYYRAMFEISQPIYGIPMDITTTIDLRRYLPDHKTEAIRNFSGGFYTSISRVKNEAFDDTLSRVMHAVNKIKRGRPGLQNAIGGEYVEKMSFLPLLTYYQVVSEVNKIMLQYPTLNSNICFPGLSNLGFLSKPLIKFGENTITDAYVIPPAVRAPGLLLIVSTYNGVITLGISYYKDTINRNTAENLLNKVKDEIMKGCV